MKRLTSNFGKSNSGRFCDINRIDDWILEPVQLITILRTFLENIKKK